MKLRLLLLLLSLSMMRMFATGEASTYFQIFIPPNNNAAARDVCLIVTALYDSTAFQIVDDGADGDTDDSKSGILMAGQSYVLFIRENGVNDDAPHSGESGTKQDGDYFIITSDKLILTSQSTKSDWQHDWVPSINKTSKGTRYLIYSPPTSFSPRDINLFAYEDSTEITISKISTAATNGQGYTEVNLATKEILVQRTLNIGEDIIFTYTDGRDILQAGETYLVESSKEVTAQYGALSGNARDGGGYVPSDNGSSTGDLFYFTIPYQAAREQEIRIVSWDTGNQVILDKFVNGVWINVDSWTLGELEPGDWVSYGGNVDKVFRVSCSAGKQVSVFEANWLETGSPGTSDIASMVSGQNGYSAGTSFLTYMSPPGHENNVTDPFTGLKFTQGSHLYLFAKDSTTVTITDAYTNGQKINRTYTIAAGRYADCNLDLAEWKSIYNGDGNPNSGPERPYLQVTATEPISILNTNFNDNWMTYMGTPLPQAFSIGTSSLQNESFPGDTINIVMEIDLNQVQTVTNTSGEINVGDGAIVLLSEFVNQTTNERLTGTITYNPNSGQSIVTFDSLPDLQNGSIYTFESAVILSANYADGSPISDRTVITVEGLITGTVGGTTQQSATSVGIVNETSQQSALRFTKLDDGSDLVTELGDNWSVSFVDYNNDGYDDIFLPGYGVEDGNMLYRNTGTGFVRINFGPLVNELGSGVVSTWGDFDNDGDEDVFVASNVQSVNYLYRNDGNGVFTKVTAGDITEGDGYYHSASWVDVDNDGLLDLFTVDYMPTQYNKLYKNNGDGTFTELTDAGELVTSAARNIGATWADFDMDGDEDVFIPNVNGEDNELYRNDGNGSFTRITTGPVVSDGGNSVGSSWGDIDNDGDLDLFVTNASNEPNYLYTNNGDGTFTKVTTGTFESDLGNSSGSVFGDIDNDGDLDLYVTNDQNEAKFLYINDGLGNFVKDSVGVETSAVGNTFGTAMSDIDNDGDLDIFVATHSDEPNALFINNLDTTNNWVTLKLVGTNSNRSAIGATVRILADIDGQAVWQTRHIGGQSGGGAGGQSSLTLHFGLAEATQIDSVVISWPSGYTQTQGSTDVNQLHTIVEESGTRVAGTVFFDSNNNCTQDTLEAGIEGIMLEITPGPTYVTTDNEGAYEAWLPDGTYSIQPVNATGWTQLCPLNGAAQSASISTTGQAITNLDFGMGSLCNDPDLQVELGSTALRKGLRNSYVINFRNEGIATAYQVNLTLQVDEEVMALNANIPWTQSGSDLGVRYYTWLWDSIPALSSMTIYVEDSISITSTLGQNITAQVTATHNATDCDLTNNQRTEIGEVVGSVDPNDKLVFPKGTGPQGFITESDTLTYKIRFQNVGTFPAQRVEILDTLSEGLNWESIQIGQMSHEGQVHISEDGVIRWVFDNIQLPDSVRDETNSHGYVIFRIVPRNDQKGGTTIQNTAYIQFDYNPYIATNTVLNTLSHAPVSSNRGDNSLICVPNPMQEESWIYPMNAIGDLETITGKSLEIFSLDGRLVRKVALQSESPWKMEKQGLQAGLYLLKIKNQKGEVYHGKLIVQ